MSDKATFDPAQNAENAAAFLDKQLQQIAKPGDAASTVAHDSLLALQADSIPVGMQAQVHANLLKIDPKADDVLKQNFPDFQLTDNAAGPLMRVADNTAPQDTGTLALRDAAIDMGGQLFSTGKLNADSVNTLNSYASASAQQEAAGYVTNDMHLLGMTNALAASDKGPGFFGTLLQMSAPDQFVGVKGEYDLIDQSGNKLSKVGSYSEQSAGGNDVLVRVGQSYVPLPGGGVITVDMQNQ
jgi:hypothetical protein